MFVLYGTVDRSRALGQNCGAIFGFHWRPNIYLTTISSSATKSNANGLEWAAHYVPS